MEKPWEARLRLDLSSGGSVVQQLKEGDAGACQHKEAKERKAQSSVQEGGEVTGNFPCGLSH